MGKWALFTDENFEEFSSLLNIFEFPFGLTLFFFKIPVPMIFDCGMWIVPPSPENGMFLS
jgi:hypothetical protein